MSRPGVPGPDVCITHLDVRDVVEVRLRFGGDAMRQAMTMQELEALERGGDPLAAVELLAGAIARNRQAVQEAPDRRDPIDVVGIEQRMIAC